MISVLLPFHNERENLLQLYNGLTASLVKLNTPYELIFIDDGSTDNSVQALENKTGNDKVILIRLEKRLGKGRALNHGLRKAKGDIIVFMDADLQDDPDDLPALIAKINQGYDLVNGVRFKRRDNAVIRFYSRMGNRFLAKFLNSPFTDINCGFKAFRRSVLDEITLYANNFRFLPLAAYYRGFRVAEIKVHNKPRIHGKSKYGARKLIFGIFDTSTAYFLYHFAEQPLYFFGIIGGGFFLVGLVMAVILTIQRLFFGMLLYQRPALLLSALLIIVGLQIVMTGIIGELIVYVNKRNKS